MISRLGLEDLFPASKYQSSFKMLSANSSLNATNEYYRHIAPSAPGARKQFLLKNLNLFFNPVLLLLLVFLLGLFFAALFNL